jgi:hypothetical protein
MRSLCPANTARRISAATAVGYLVGDRPTRQQVGLRVDEQPLRHTDRGVPEACGQRVDHLEHGRRERRAESERLRAAPGSGDQQGERLVVVQPRELGLEAGQQRETPVPAAFRVDRDTGRGQRLDVAQHGADGHPQLTGQRGRRQPTTLAQQQHQGDQPVGAHTRILPGIRDTRCRDDLRGSSA